VIRLLEEKPKAAGVYSKYHAGYPLHWACRKQAPLEVIVALTKAFPDVVDVPTHKLNGIRDDFDKYQMYPLQHALCHAKASLDVIRFLTSQWPEVLKEYIVWGYFALHLACDANVSLPIIQFLVEQWPGALQEKGVYGSPLHHACRSGADISTIHFLLQAWPEAVQTSNEYEATLPLHEACRYRGQHAEVVAWSEYLKAARAVAAADDSIPQPPPPPPVLLLLQTLVQAWPAAVRVSDNENYLPLHYLCTDQPALLSDVKLLVEAYPEALQDGTRGWLPLHLACRYHSPRGCDSVFDRLLSTSGQNTKRIWSIAIAPGVLFQAARSCRVGMFHTTVARSRVGAIGLYQNTTTPV